MLTNKIRAEHSSKIISASVIRIFASLAQACDRYPNKHKHKFKRFNGLTYLRTDWHEPIGENTLFIYMVYIRIEKAQVMRQAPVYIPFKDGEESIYLTNLRRHYMARINNKQTNYFNFFFSFFLFSLLFGFLDY